jgi:hypothetical protein
LLDAVEILDVLFETIDPLRTFLTSWGSLCINFPFLFGLWRPKKGTFSLGFLDANLVFDSSIKISTGIKYIITDFAVALGDNVALVLH